MLVFNGGFFLFHPGFHPGLFLPTGEAVKVLGKWLTLGEGN